MIDVVTIGEGMLRLSPPRFHRIRRAQSLDLHVCGSQGNVACNISRLGLNTAFVTKVPDSDLGHLMRDHYMSCGVDTRFIKTQSDSRLGVNYIEFGATPRASKVIYDRRNSAASTISPDDYDWDNMLKGVRLAYTDGILPGLSDTCRAATTEFIAAAKRQKCMIAFDINYREHLWAPEVAKECLSQILPRVDVLVTTQWDSETVFGYTGEYAQIIRQFADEFGCTVVGITLRKVIDVLRGGWNTMVLANGEVREGHPYPVDMIDRFGAGDSWGSGFLFAYLETGDPFYAMEFGNATCALHHTIPGDVAQVSREEVEELMASNDFRVKR